MAVLTTDAEIAEAVRRSRGERSFPECPSLPYFLTSRLRWVDKVDTWVHQLWYGVENLIDWFPLIWGDRDWDHRYCSDILRHKLLRMAALQEKYGNGLYAHRYAKQMRICAELLRRVEADEYNENLEKPNGLSRPVHWFVGEHIDEREFKQRSRIYKQAGRQRKSELGYCFKLMSKHYLGWWD